MGLNLRTEGSLKRFVVVGIAAVMVMVMSGCTDNNTNNVNGTNTTDKDNNTTNEVLQIDFDSEATVVLKPTDGGTATGEALITYNEETKVMSLEVEVTGLEPDSEHAQHLHPGTCEQPGDPIHQLDNLKANGDGEASTTNTFQGVESLDATNMVLNIHHGSDLEGDNAKQISCGHLVVSE